MSEVAAIHEDLIGMYERVRNQAAAAALLEYRDETPELLEQALTLLDRDQPGYLGVRERAWMDGTRDALIALTIMGTGETGERSAP